MRHSSGGNRSVPSFSFPGNHSPEFNSPGVYLANILREAKSNLQVDNEELRNGVTYALFGGSGSGKSTLLRKIFVDDVYSNQNIRKKRDEYIPLFFTESKYADPLKGISDGGSSTILDSCGVNADLYKWMYMMNYTYEKAYNFVTIVDDVITVKNIPIIFKAFLTYRNMNITSVVSLQYLKLCPLSIRASLYFVFLLSTSNNDAIRQFVEAYMFMYLPGKNVPEKMNLFFEMTRNYCFFLIDNLRHKCFYVDSDYMAYEMERLSAEETFNRASSSGVPSSSSSSKSLDNSEAPDLLEQAAISSAKNLVTDPNELFDKNSH